MTYITRRNTAMHARNADQNSRLRLKKRLILRRWDKCPKCGETYRNSLSIHRQFRPTCYACSEAKKRVDRSSTKGMDPDVIQAILAIEKKKGRKIAAPL